MSESFVVEIYENQQQKRFSSDKTWIPSRKMPWLVAAAIDEFMLFQCIEPDEMVLPAANWCWMSNWRIENVSLNSFFFF